MTFGTWRWWGCQPHAPDAFTPRKCSWYSFSLGAELTVGRNMSLKNPVTPPGIDPRTVRVVAQRLNHYATPGPEGILVLFVCVCLCIYTHTNIQRLASNEIFSPSKKYIGKLVGLRTYRTYTSLYSGIRRQIPVLWKYIKACIIKYWKQRGIWVLHIAVYLGFAFIPIPLISFLLYSVFLGHSPACSHDLWK
jgi:hypothetical protein